MSKLFTHLGRNQKFPICFNFLELNAILYRLGACSFGIITPLDLCWNREAALMPLRPTGAQDLWGPLEPIPKSHYLCQAHQEAKKINLCCKCVSTQFRVRKTVDQKWWSMVQTHSQSPNPVLWGVTIKSFALAHKIAVAFPFKNDIEKQIMLIQGFVSPKELIPSKLPCFGHLMQTSSMEKSLMLGKIEGRRRRGHQRMRFLDSIINAMNMNLGKLREMARDRETWRAAVHGVTKSQTCLGNWKTATHQMLPPRWQIECNLNTIQSTVFFRVTLDTGREKSLNLESLIQ